MSTLIKTTFALTLAASTVIAPALSHAQQTTPLQTNSGTGTSGTAGTSSGTASGNTDTSTSGGGTLRGTDSSGNGGDSTQGGSLTNGNNSGSTSGTTTTKSGTTAGQTGDGSAAGTMDQTGTDGNGQKATSGSTSSSSQTNVQQNSTNVDVNISSEQRTEIHDVIVKEKVAPVSVDIDLSVGVVVPKKKVKLHRLPARIVEIVPAYKGYDYFVLSDGRIVIVEPASYKVVTILTM